MEQLTKVKAEVKDVLKNNILSFWLEHMTDPEHGGFYGQMKGDGTLVPQASKGGILTANFIAQTEQVKAAIETQMVQLREQLEEQGVKVEALDVTVQTHQFEQSLDQSSQQSDSREASQGRRIRRIRLGGEEDIQPEELDEADRITAEMMEANGNTVDYTV